MNVATVIITLTLARILEAALGALCVLLAGRQRV